MCFYCWNFRPNVDSTASDFFHQNYQDYTDVINFCLSALLIVHWCKKNVRKWHSNFNITLYQNINRRLWIIFTEGKIKMNCMSSHSVCMLDDSPKITPSERGFVFVSKQNQERPICGLNYHISKFTTNFIQYNIEDLSW